MLYLEIALSALFSFVSLFLLAKLMGRRQMSELSMFDYINGITIGSIAAEMATSPINETPKHLTAMAVYTAMVVLLSFVSDKSRRARKFIEGEPKVILEDGRIDRKNLKMAKLDTDEFLMLCRGAGHFDPSELESAVLEPNGRISFLPKAENRPYTAGDASIPKKKEYKVSVLVSDGEPVDENLGVCGYDRNTLAIALKNLGYNSPGEIMLCVFGADGCLHVFPKSQNH